MSTICNHCFEIMEHRRAGFYCPNCQHGILIDINSYVDFTSPMQPKLKLYRHPRSLTIFTEKGFLDEFNMNACRVISEDYIKELPQFLPVINIDHRLVPKDIIKRHINAAKTQIAAYSQSTRRNYLLSDNAIKNLIFLNLRKEKLLKINSLKST